MACKDRPFVLSLAYTYSFQVRSPSWKGARLIDVAIAILHGILHKYVLLC